MPSHSRYISLLCIHTLILAFTALFLPGTTFRFVPLPPPPSSLDKPQYPWLDPLTAIPPWTLFWLCIGTGTCQAWWAGWMRVWWNEGEKANGPAEAISHAGGGKIQTLRNAWMNTIFTSVLFHAIIILFGAPISSYIPHTYFLSLLLSILTVFVPSYTLSLPFRWFWVPGKDETDLHWVKLFLRFNLEKELERDLVYPVLGSFLGCWAGAFPIPLDWDRPWQSWPLTPAYGALAGHLLGSWASFLVNTTLFLASQDVPPQPASDKGINVKRRQNKMKGE